MTVFSAFYLQLHIEYARLDVMIHMRHTHKNLYYARASSGSTCTSLSSLNVCDYFSDSILQCNREVETCLQLNSCARGVVENVDSKTEPEEMLTVT